MESEEIAVCLKTQSGRVFYQNKCCVQLCGDQVQRRCSQGCMRLYQRQNSDRNQAGTQVFHGQKIEGKPCDVILMNDGQTLFTLLLDLSKKVAADLQYFSQFNLSKREMEVLELVLQGYSNSRIARKLFISPATLKTHLNRIYAKVPDSLITRDRAQKK